jgi:hypothetical protein
MSEHILGLTGPLMIQLIPCFVPTVLVPNNNPALLLKIATLVFFTRSDVIYSLPDDIDIVFNFQFLTANQLR